MRVYVVLSVLLVGLFLLSCTPQSAPAGAPAVPAPSTAPTRAGPGGAPAAAPAKPAWQDTWERTLAAAKQEGKVVFSGSLGPEARASISEALRQTYGISGEAVAGVTSQVVERIITERRAGLYNYDIYVGGSTNALNYLKPAGALDRLDTAFITPDLTDPEVIKKTWWPGQLWFVDADHTSMAPMLTIIMPIVINTTMVKDGEITSYKDLLNPKWQGKMMLFDPSIPGTGPAWLAYVEAKFGWDYAVQFSKMQPVVMRDRRLLIEWVAQGKYPMVVAPPSDTYVQFKNAGAPIKGLIPKEGTWVLSSIVDLSLLKNAPHPNAAKIFVNWYLSKEGQTVVGPPTGYQSNRLDVTTSYLPAEQVRQPGVDYFIEEDEKLQLSQADRMKRAAPLFTPK